MISSKASLKIFTKGKSLSEVWQIFARSEDFGYSQGTPVGSAHKTYEETMWAINSVQPDSGTLDDHLSELLSWLESRSNDYRG